MRHHAGKPQQPIASVCGRADHRRGAIERDGRGAKMLRRQVGCISADEQHRCWYPCQPGAEIAVALINDSDIVTEPLSELGRSRARHAHLESEAARPHHCKGLLDEACMQTRCAVGAERRDQPGLGSPRRGPFSKDCYPRHRHPSLILVACSSAMAIIAR